MSLQATVIVPTTGDRGPLLPYSIGSILQQTTRDIEVIIIGDGVDQTTRSIIGELCRQDDRIAFHDHPKHQRRGEVYRHEALQDARGKMVCYLCDRDLMLPNHIEVLSRLLADYNFVSTTHFSIQPDQEVRYDSYIKYFGAGTENNPAKVKQGVISLSNVGHTLELYRQLPHGWRTTPRNKYTDIYMWQQFMRHPDCRPYSSSEATVLYFKREHYPGWPVNKRLPELEHWAGEMEKPGTLERIRQQAMTNLMRERQHLREAPVLIKGMRFNRYLRMLYKIARRRLFH